MTTFMDNNNQVSIIPLGGIGDVTRNMYLYEYKDQILIVDCGLGFADETMLGVDLLLPDISYLLKTNKKIVGMVLTHGHEDHIGSTPFILPQLPQFPVYGTPLTAALTNAKLQEYRAGRSVQAVPFKNAPVKIGDFSVEFIRVTHSVPDTAHLFIRTPVGNFYHGSDFKFDLTPADGKKTDFQKITRLASSGVLCHLSDCLGSERVGASPSESLIAYHFEREMRDCKGKFIITTYSSNISRLNQAIGVAQKLGRHVCFIGRSLIKAKEVGQKLGYMQIPQGMEIEVNQLKNYADNKVLLLVAGSQGQENSGMARIASGEHKDIKLDSRDVIVFSSDPIPGNEVMVNALVDTIAKAGCRVLYSAISHDFHVSGHGYMHDLMLSMNLVKGKTLLPIGGTFRHMKAYGELAKSQGYAEKDVFLIDDGQEIIFSRTDTKLGRKIPIKKVYVDQISGEEVESFVLRDRQKLSMEGVVIVMAEIDASNGTLANTPEIVIRGFSPKETGVVQKTLTHVLKQVLQPTQQQVLNWAYIRKRISETAEQKEFKELHRRPLILPVIVEV